MLDKVVHLWYNIDIERRYTNENKAYTQRNIQSIFISAV